MQCAKPKEQLGVSYTVDSLPHYSSLRVGKRKMVAAFFLLAAQS